MRKIEESMIRGNERSFSKEKEEFWGNKVEQTEEPLREEQSGEDMRERGLREITKYLEEFYGGSKVEVLPSTPQYYRSRTGSLYNYKCRKGNFNLDFGVLLSKEDPSKMVFSLSPADLQITVGQEVLLSCEVREEGDFLRYKALELLEQGPDEFMPLPLKDFPIKGLSFSFEDIFSYMLGALAIYSETWVKQLQEAISRLEGDKLLLKRLGASFKE